MDKSTSGVLRRVQDTLEIAKAGLQQMRDGNGAARLAGLSNVAVFGRAVTFALQNLRNIEPDFEAWYGQWEQRMRSDPIAKFMVEVRNKVEKQGGPPVKHSTGVLLNGVLDPENPPLKGPRPPGAVGAFTGDHLGRSGWEVQLPDGSTERYYAEVSELAGVKVDTKMHFVDAPKEVSALSVDEVASRYLAVLEELVKDARAKFNK